MKRLCAVLWFLFSFSAAMPQANLVGHWTFDSPTSLTKAEVGNDLVLVGTHQAVPGPEDGNGAVRIGVGSHYIVTHGMAHSGGGNRVNEFSLVMDVKIPQAEQWYCMYQTTLANSDDGDWFIKSNLRMGVGATGYTTESIQPNEWYRIAIAVKNGKRYDYYIDGHKALTGKPGIVDGRFSLGTAFLLFADQNGEDNEIDVADVKLFSRALSDSEMQQLGGCKHVKIDTAIHPYLQSPTAHSIYVCWHAANSTESVVEYGTTPSLGHVQSGDVHIFSEGTTWHWVKLTDLEPETVYYYRAISDTLVSDIYTFKTPPAIGQKTGHIRFAVLGDTRTYPDRYAWVVKNLKDKVEELYDGPIEENLNVLLSVGDIVTYGPVLSQYRREYFEPLEQISASIPIMVSIGDHEHDDPIYYDYMKYEDFAGPEGELYYSFRLGRVLFIAIHYLSSTYTQIWWLDNLLKAVQQDSTIDWIFAFEHRPGHSELWPDGNEPYIQNKVIPTLKKYPKADMLMYGHSHNYERGQVVDGNLRLNLNGGGGAGLDSWRAYPNQTDYPEIQKSFDYWCYTIFDIDIANKSYLARSYTLGNKSVTFNNELFDQFFRNKADETPPDTPSLLSPADGAFSRPPFFLQASPYSGHYDQLSSQFQITTTRGDYSHVVIDRIRDFEDIYYDSGPPYYKPIDQNKGIDLTKYMITGIGVKNGTTYYWRVRYRDRNLQWSDWSEERSFTVSYVTTVHENDGVMPLKTVLHNNYPNPFNPSTTITFDIARPGHVSLEIYSLDGKRVVQLLNKRLNAGKYSVVWNGTDSSGLKVSSGTYFIKLVAGGYNRVVKTVMLK